MKKRLTLILTALLMSMVCRNHGVGSSDHIILKNVLTVDASKHHMVDACSALFPYLCRKFIN